jgi:TolB protein
MATDGANQTRLTQNIDPQGADICPSWSPDGGQLVFASVRATGSGIYRVNADGSNLTQLIHEELSTRDVVCPVFSPDGMRIAYSTTTSLSLRNASQIVVINRDGTAPMRLSSDSQNDTAPAWSLDGSKIAFMSGPNRPWQICIMNASGANRRCLTDDDTEHIFPKWMP